MPITQILLTAATVSASTYTLTPAANNVDEGSSLEFTVGGTNITNGTYYWTIETNAGDFATTNGTVSVTNNSGTFSVTPDEDVTTEGAQTFTVALRSVSITGTILVTSAAVTINDTSTYSGTTFAWKGDANSWTVNGTEGSNSVYSDPAPTNPDMFYSNYTGKTRNFTGSEYMISSLLNNSGAWPSNAIAIDFWFYPTTNSVQLISEIDSQNSGAGYNYSVLEINGNNTVSAYFYNGTPFISTNTVTLNQWNHIYFAEDDQGGHLFELNGVPTNGLPTYTRSGPGNTNEHFIVGSSTATYHNTGITSRFQGRIGYLTISDYPAGSTYSATSSLFPTYTITAAAESVDEGSGLEFTVGGTNIANGTYYWTVSGTGPFDADDGSFTITDNAGSITVTPTANQTTDNVGRPFTVSIRSGSTSGPVLRTSSSVVINDTSQDPTYTITPDADNVNEGSSLTFTIGGTDITNGTYYWTVTNSGDFGTANGEFEITGNSGTFSVTPIADVTTEGEETFTVSIRSGSISGTVLQTSDSITINDTSLAPEPPFSLEFVNSQNDYLDVAGSSDFNLGTNWTIEFWISANSSSINAGGGIWGLLNQVGWSTTNNIVVALSDAKLVFLSGSGANDDVRYVEPTPNGVPTGVFDYSGGGGWNQGYTNRATTGGTGTGLTVNIAEGSGGYIDINSITINNPGSGYTNGDVITIYNEYPELPATFFIDVASPVVWTHVAIANDNGTQKVYYNGIEQAKVSGTFGTASYTNGTDPIRIGRLGPQNGGTFDGKLAMIRISNTAKYLTAFTPSTTYDVETDTVLFLDSDTPLIGQSYFELNGVAISANGGENIYFAKLAYPNLDNQVQIGDTVVGGTPTTTATVTGAVFTADPDNWGVPVSAIFSALSTANFSGTRSASVTNNGTTESESFPATYTVRQWLATYDRNASASTLNIRLSDYPDAASIPVGAITAIGSVASNSPHSYLGTTPSRTIIFNTSPTIWAGDIITFTWPT
jgi:hypothetical protein